MRFKTRLSLDIAFKYIFKVTGFLVLAALAGILGMLIYNSFSFFMDVRPLDFITGVEWNPTGKNPKYGMMPLIVSTTLVTFVAMLIAIPVIEMLAAVPSVVIGFLGIVLVGPGIANLANLPNGLNALNGAILLSVMALPTIITIAEDAIHAIPKTYKEASYALGATKWETLCRVTIPAAAPGIIAAIMLGVGRAVGETMTVLMVTGNASLLPDGMFDSVKTMTATIAIEMGEVPYRTTHYFALYAIATVLFGMTLVANLVGEYFINRFRKYHAA